MHKNLDHLIGRLPMCNPSFTSDFVHPFSGERRRDASGIHFEGPLGSCHPEYPVEISQNRTTQSYTRQALAGKPHRSWSHGYGIMIYCLI